MKIIFGIDVSKNTSTVCELIRVTAKLDSQFLVDDPAD